MAEEAKFVAENEREGQEPEARQQEESGRTFFINNPSANAVFRFPSNAIKTSRYDAITFIPVNLFEQFRRLANFYFLCTVLLQLIPGVSPFPLWTVAGPLAFILGVTMIKEAYEDIVISCLFVSSE
jgi:hypothetical protein